MDDGDDDVDSDGEGDDDDSDDDGDDTWPVRPGVGLSTPNGMYH